MSHNQLWQNHGTSHDEPKTISWHNHTKKPLVRKEDAKPEAAEPEAVKPKVVEPETAEGLSWLA